MLGRLIVLWVLGGLSGCSVSLRGAVYPDEQGRVMLHLPDGGTRRLVLDRFSAPMAGLEGEGVRIEGRQRIGGVRVKEWTVPEGTRGLQVWVGVLEQRDGTLRVFDRNARATYLLDDRGHPELHRALGRTVLVEGWVVGANAVRVAYAKVLDGPEQAQ